MFVMFVLIGCPWTWYCSPVINMIMLCDLTEAMDAPSSPVPLPTPALVMEQLWPIVLVWPTRTWSLCSSTLQVIMHVCLSVLVVIVVCFLGFFFLPAIWYISHRSRHRTASDNYSFKFSKSDLAWKLLFPFFPGGHQELWKGQTNFSESRSTLTYTHTPCWLRLVMWSDCFALRKLFPARYVTLAHNFLETRLAVMHWPKFVVC